MEAATVRRAIDDAAITSTPTAHLAGGYRDKLLHRRFDSKPGWRRLQVRG